MKTFIKKTQQVSLVFIIKKLLLNSNLILNFITNKTQQNLQFEFVFLCKQGNQEMSQRKQRMIETNIKSTQIKRGFAWNVLQPGDPYDIKKSMIAELPSHKPIFMGDNLQLICLFQAAQIQRLSLFLNQMTLKNRQVERVELDRHSYEVQIKQLAQKIVTLNGMKIQNQKLKQFIKRQSQQMQNLQRHRNSSQILIQLQSKYESVLNQLRITRENSSSLQKSNNQLLQQITEWRFKYEKVQKLFSQEKLKGDRQIKIRIETAINEYKIIFESKQYQLKGQINVIKQNLSLKNRQIEIQKSKNFQLSKLLSFKQEQLLKYKNGEIQTTSSKTQEILKISKRLQQTTFYLEQSEKLNVNLKDQISYLTKKIKTLEQEIKRKQLQFKMKQQKLVSSQQLTTKLAQIQTKSKTLKFQIQRLNEVVQRKIREIGQKDKQLSFHKQKAIAFQKNVEQLSRELIEKQNSLRNFQAQFSSALEKDAKIQTLAREIDRLNFVLQQKVHQISIMQNKFKDYSSIQVRYNTIIRSKDQSAHVQEQRVRQYQAKMRSLQEANRLNFQEINKLNIKLAGIQNENIQLRRQLDTVNQTSLETDKFKGQIFKLKEQINLKIVENRKLREDNEQMFRQINQLNQNSKLLESKGNKQNLTLNQRIQEKINQINRLYNNQKSYLLELERYEKSVPQLLTQNQRLQSLLEKKQGEIIGLQQDLGIEKQKGKRLEQKHSSQYELNIIQYEKKISFLQAKCDNYEKAKRQLIEERELVLSKLQSLQFKLHEGHQQLERFKSTLKIKQTSDQQYNKRVNMLQNTINKLQQQNVSYQSEAIRSRQQLQTNIETIKNFQFQIDRMKRDIPQQKNQINTLRQENNRLRSTTGQRQNLLGEIGNLRQTIQRMTNTMKNLEYELQKCRRQLNEEEGNYLSLQQQYSRLRQQLNNNESRLISQNQGLKQAVQSMRVQLSSWKSQKQSLLSQVSSRQSRLQVSQQLNRSLNNKIIQFQQNIRHIQQGNSLKIEQFKQKIIHQNQYKLKQANGRYTILLEKYNELNYRYETQMRRGNVDDERVRGLEHENNQLRRNMNQYQQKLFKYQQKIALISQQIQRLVQQNTSQKIQLQSTNKNQSSINSMTQELQNTKIQLINIKTMLQQYQSINQHTISQRDELFKITHEQELEINHLRNQVNQLNHQNQQNQHAQSYQQQFFSLKDQYSLLHNQFINMQNFKVSLQNQLRLVKQQLFDYKNNTNHTVVNEYQFKINQISERYQLELNNQRQKSYECSVNLEKQAKALYIIQQRNNELSNHLKQLQLQIASEQDLRNQMQDIKARYINMGVENEQLNRLLEEMQDQLFEATQQNKKTKSGYNQQYNQLLEENNRLKGMLDQERISMNQLKQKLTAVLNQIQLIKRQAQAHVRSIQSKYFPFQQQNISLLQQLQHFNRQNINLQHQYDQLNQQFTKISIYQQISLQWQNKYNQLYQAYNETYTVYNDLKIQYQNIKQSLRIYSQIKQIINQTIISRLPQLQEQFSKLNHFVNQLKHQRETLKQQLIQQDQLLNKNLHLQKAIDRLQLMNRSLNQEISETRIRLTNQNALQRRIQQHLTLFVVLFAEIETLRKRLHQIEEQCEDVRRNSLSPHKIKR